MIKSLFIFCFALFFVSCQTIHYTNKSRRAPQNYPYSKWHHIGFYGLVELSDTVNVQSICGDKNWKAVRTRTGPVQALIPLLVGGILSSLGLPLGNNAIYTPEEAAVACAR